MNAINEEPEPQEIEALMPWYAVLRRVKQTQNGFSLAFRRQQPPGPLCASKRDMRESPR
jgi:hypothetical protein